MSGYPNQGFPNPGGYGQEYNQGGYDQGYNQGGYNQNQGYGQGYDQGYNQGYNQGGYNQGGYSQGGNPGDLDLSSLDPNTPLDVLIGQLAGDPSVTESVRGITTYETSARDLEGFDMGEFEARFGSSGEDMSRGIFSFGGGEGKSKTSHQLLGGAAAWAAFKWYENWKRNTTGEKVKHSTLKKMLTAFAVAQVIKVSEKRSSTFQQGLSREVAIEEATRNVSKIASTLEAEYNTSQPAYQYNSYGGGEAENFDRY
ncbi:hypothetical protein H4R18_003122 [Coemansia javaensis]|uniref:Uncharacterized protein n=1 Tax=Coemansia javaensis TaxID=2761396 RepID=A0A9W8HES6_9FUNG|nr:hypothetical protein H4R18_003122 [Coemansia javaensis]